VPPVKEPKKPKKPQPKPAKRAELAPAWRAEAGDYATALGFSADGARCAVGAASGQVLLLDAMTGAEIARIDAHPGGVLALSWSPNAALLATAGQDGAARLYRGEDGALVAELRGDAAWVEQLAWAPDGSRLAASAGRTVRLFRPDGATSGALGPHASTVTGLGWGREGRWLAASCYGGVSLWDTSGESPQQTLPWQGSLISLCWSPDRKVMACGSQDCSVHFWRLPGGDDSEMRGYPFKPKALAWSADSTLLATSGEATVTLWDFGGKGPEGSRPILLEGHQGVLTDLAFSPKGTLLASGAQDMGVIVWAPRHKSAFRGYGFLEDAISRVAWHPSGELLAAADASGRVQAWKGPWGH